MSLSMQLSRALNFRGGYRGPRALGDFGKGSKNLIEKVHQSLDLTDFFCIQMQFIERGKSQKSGVDFVNAILSALNHIIIVFFLLKIHL